MIHPHTELVVADAARGYGVVATRDLPRGTLVWVLDALDGVIAPDSPLLAAPAYAPVIAKYTFENGGGTRVLHWDLAKYINHSCDSNLVTPRGANFSILVRDVAAGGEITDDYGLYYGPADAPLACMCGSPRCRGVIAFDPTGARRAGLERDLAAALEQAAKVDQPLLAFATREAHAELLAALATGSTGALIARCLGDRDVRSQAP
jgi:hypothetical protein